MLLYYAVATLHIIVCVILVLVVLLQSSRGADLAGAFGGGATQTAFGSRGPASFLSKMTTVAAIIFMLTSIGLTLIVGNRTESSKSVLETTKQQQTTRPAKKQPAQPQQPALSPEQIKKIQEEYEAKQKQQGTPAPAQQQPSNPAQPKPPAPGK